MTDHAPSLYVVTWRACLNGGRMGPLNSYTFNDHPVTKEHADNFLRKVLARAQHVTGKPFVGKVEARP